MTQEVHYLRGANGSSVKSEIEIPPSDAGHRRDVYKRQPVGGGETQISVYRRSTRARWGGLIVLLFAIGVELPFALAQPACPETITACGCRILSPGKYTLGNSVASSSTTEDCVDVNSGGVELDLAGFSVTGPLANPLIASDQVTAVAVSYTHLDVYKRQGELQ